MQMAPFVALVWLCVALGVILILAGAAVLLPPLRRVMTRDTLADVVRIQGQVAAARRALYRLEASAAAVPTLAERARAAGAQIVVAAHRLRETARALGLAAAALRVLFSGR